MALRERLPPEELTSGPRTHACLVLPFGEPAHPEHEEAGRTFGWSDVRLPRKEVPVTEGHDGPEIGIAIGIHQGQGGDVVQRQGRRPWRAAPRPRPLRNFSGDHPGW